MTQTQLRPACGGRTGLGIRLSSPAFATSEDNTLPLHFQAHRAAVLIARRFSVPMSTAAVLATLAGYREGAR